MVVNRSAPPGTVIPVLIYDDVPAAADWLCAVFGFSVRLRIADHRAQLVYRNGAVIIRDRPAGPTPDRIDPAPDVPARQYVHVSVVDVDAHHDRAAAGGAGITQPPTDFFFGERQYTALDLGGHEWTFSESKADIDPRDWGASFGGPG